MPISVGLQKKQKRADTPAGQTPVTEQMVQRQIALAAGTEKFQHRDPSFHLTETFRQTFDLMGQQRMTENGPETAGRTAQRLSMGEEAAGLDSFSAQTHQQDSTSPKGLEEQPGGWYDPAQTDMDSRYEPRAGQEGRLQRFAEVSFQRGNLSAAVVRGTGKMMLFSCLKRTIGQENSKQMKERKLFQTHSVHREIPRAQGNMAVVNRGFTDSAVGLVVDVLKDARQSLDSLTAMAEGKSGIDQTSGVGTLRKQYPFLDVSQEKELLAQYDARLKELDDSPENEEERQILLMAQQRVHAVMQKKEQMKREFLQKLRFLSDRAAAAAEAFWREDFRQELAEALAPAPASEEPETPPETPPEDTPPADDGGPEGEPDGEEKMRRPKRP